LTWSFWLYLVRSTSYQAPQYVSFSTLLLFHPFWVQIFSSESCSQTFFIFSSLNMNDQVPHPYRTTAKILNGLNLRISQLCLLHLLSTAFVVVIGRDVQGEFEYHRQ
jgi:hypothetical protein